MRKSRLVRIMNSGGPRAAGSAWGLAVVAVAGVVIAIVYLVSRF
jgi:hypothetical protein